MAVKFRDYYEVLGVPRTASADDIRKAYRRLARKHHPDLAPAAERDQATETFKQINEANEVLSDPEKRKRYDALGEHWKSGMDFAPGGAPGGGPGGRGWPGGPGGVDPGQWEDLDGFSDFFASVFGRPGPGGGRRAGRRGVRISMPGADIESELPVTLEELLHGGRRRISLGGERTLDVTVPVGARDGTVLRLAGQGQPGMGGGEAGDLYLHLRLIPHARYRALGDDLEMDLPLWPWQAVLGDTVRVETPAGPVSLKVAAGTPNGLRLRLKSRGLPRAQGDAGDLYAVVRIEVPERPGADEREAYEALKRTASAPAGQPARGEGA